MGQKFPKLFLVLLGFLLILNLFQAGFTELLYDEAYYWYYSQNLNWGYFDHPPMVALMIYVGTLFFESELGVRLVSCFMGVGTYIILWCIITHPQKRDYTIHFFLLLFSMALINAFGFFSLPDTPLLFFTALFLYLYKKYTFEKNIFLAFGLGLTMAALMYSKYHAILVIFFVFLSNWHLLFDKLAWLAVFVALLCFTPHLIWLYQNDFVTVKYHLFERPDHPYRFSRYTLAYFLNLVSIFGLLFPWAYWTLFKSRSNASSFNKALRYLSFGFILFFFVTSFTTRVQAQWLVVICIPAALLVFDTMIKNAAIAKWVYRMGIVSVILLLYARIWLVHDSLLPIYYETHGNKDWVKKITDEVGDIPVVFKNSYRNASKYAFYSGNLSFSLNTIDSRQNQYTIDDSESNIQGKKVAYITENNDNYDFQYIKRSGNAYQGRYIDSFSSYRKLKCFLDDVRLEIGQIKNMEIKVYNPYDIAIPIGNLEFFVTYLNSYKEPNKPLKIECFLAEEEELYLKAKDTTSIMCSIPEPPSEYVHYLRFGIAENGLLPGMNSKTIKLKF